MGTTSFLRSSSTRSRQRSTHVLRRGSPRTNKLKLTWWLLGCILISLVMILQVLLQQWTILGDVSFFTNTAISKIPAIWSWHYYSNNSTSPRILIAQSSGHDSHMEMLDITQRVNRAYARKFNYDYVALQGLTLGGYKQWHSTFDKVEILHQVVSSGNYYDGALILDADALLVNFDYDIAELLSDRYALTAQRVAKHDFHTWDLNAGVILWNMHHVKTKWLADQWHYHTRKTLQSWHPIDDQRLLHSILRDQLTQQERNSTLNTISNIFQYDQGTIVKHYCRHNKNRNTGTWSNPVGERVAKLVRIAEETCNEYKPYCEGIPSKLLRHSRVLL